MFHCLIVLSSPHWKINTAEGKKDSRLISRSVIQSTSYPSNDNMIDNSDQLPKRNVLH